MRDRRWEEPQPWDRQAGETEKAYQAFHLYRGLGARRTYAEVCRQLGRHSSQIRRWASRHEWKSRALAFDRHEQRVQQDALDQSRQEAVLQQMRTIEQVQRLSGALIASFLEQDPETGRTHIAAHVSERTRLGLLRFPAQQLAALDSLGVSAPPAPHEGPSELAPDPLRNFSNEQLQNLGQLLSESPEPIHSQEVPGNGNHDPTP